MSSPFRFRRHCIARLLVPATVALSLAGCGSGQSAGQETGVEATASSQAKHSYPAGGAKVLSVTGATEVPGSDPYNVAVNCAAAIQVTAQALGDFAVPVGDAEIGGLRRAQSIYRQRANAGAARKGLSARDAAVEIEKKVQAAVDDPAPQVQLTAPCLRSLVNPKGSAT